MLITLEMMMYYRDMTFCVDSYECAMKECDRRFTDEDAALAVGWRISVTSYAGTCENYVVSEGVKSK